MNMILEHQTDDATDIIFIHTQLLSHNIQKFFLIKKSFHRNSFQSDGMALTTNSLILIKIF